MLTNNPIGFETEAPPLSIKTFIQFLPPGPKESKVVYDFSKQPLLDNSFLDTQFLTSDNMTSLQNLLVCRSKSIKKNKIAPTYIQLNSTELKIINDCTKGRLFQERASQFILNLFINPEKAKEFANIVRQLLTVPVPENKLTRLLNDINN